jgi:hypothetical protein
MVRVTGRNQATSPNYRLSLNLPLPEYNDSFDLVDSAPVGINPSLGTLSGSLSLSGQVLNDTYDIYKFTVAATPGANSSISIASATPFNLSLFNSSRQSVAFASGYMGQTSLSLVNLAPGEYYVQEGTPRDEAVDVFSPGNPADAAAGASPPFPGIRHRRADPLLR